MGGRYWQIPIESKNSERKEITLWDLAGQSDYRIVHELYLKNPDVIFLLFDGSDPSNPFKGVNYWANAINKYLHPYTKKILVSSRLDICPQAFSVEDVEKKLSDIGFDKHFGISCKNGYGVDELWDYLLENTPWDNLTKTKTPKLFNFIRHLLIEEKSNGKAFISTDSIIKKSHESISTDIKIQEIEIVLNLIASQGLIYLIELVEELSLVLLQPEVLHQYASSIIRAARRDRRLMGSVSEYNILSAHIDLSDVNRLRENDEQTILQLTIEILLKNKLCYRQNGQLVFSSQISRSKTETTDIKTLTNVKYLFKGSFESIYATAVVRLNYSGLYKCHKLFNYSAEFSLDKEIVGFSIEPEDPGIYSLTVYKHPETSSLTFNLFVFFINSHLRTKGVIIQDRFQSINCDHCGELLRVDQHATELLSSNNDFINCLKCSCRNTLPINLLKFVRNIPQMQGETNSMNKAADDKALYELEEFRKEQDGMYDKSRIKNNIRILHLSDLHMDSRISVNMHIYQLTNDLSSNLKVDGIDYVVISGDIGYFSVEKEYNPALHFLHELKNHYNIDENKIIITPGNHDLNWGLSQKAYRHEWDSDRADGFSEDKLIRVEGPGILIRNDQKYELKFEPFINQFFNKLYSNRVYPLNFDDQAIAYEFEEDKIYFMSFNSAWDLDHHYRERISINKEALSAALIKSTKDKYKDWIKIAVWHHPISYFEDKRLGFMELLASGGVNICLHGHMHESLECYYKYDQSRIVHIIGAGTFSAKEEDWTPGVPQQYHLLTVEKDRRILYIESRKKEKPDGMWMADARYGDKNDPKPRESIDLNR